MSCWVWTSSWSSGDIWYWNIPSPSSYSSTKWQNRKRQNQFRGQDPITKLSQKLLTVQDGIQHFGNLLRQLLYWSLPQCSSCHNITHCTILQTVSSNTSDINILRPSLLCQNVLCDVLSSLLEASVRPSTCSSSSLFWAVSMYCCTAM